MAPEPNHFALSVTVPSSNSLFKMDDGILANNIMNLGHHALLPDPSMLKPLRLGHWVGFIATSFSPYLMVQMFIPGRVLSLEDGINLINLKVTSNWGSYHGTQMEDWVCAVVVRVY